ncbi:Nucleolar protein 58, partial [Trichinella spiralis]
LHDDLDRELNNYAMRCREWYGWHFPELGKCISDHLLYAQIVERIGFRECAPMTNLSDLLSEDLQKKVKKMSLHSLGTEISTTDLKSIKLLCKQIIEISKYRTELGNYLRARMFSLAPNLASLTGEIIGARLIARAGSLLGLSKMSASTIQIIGAEKALFRAIKTKRDTPKYGLIYHAQIISTVPQKLKGKRNSVYYTRVNEKKERSKKLTIQQHQLAGEAEGYKVEKKMKKEKHLKEESVFMEQPAVESFVEQEEMVESSVIVEVKKKKRKRKSGEEIESSEKKITVKEEKEEKRKDDDGNVEEEDTDLKNLSQELSEGNFSSNGASEIKRTTTMSKAHMLPKSLRRQHFKDAWPRKEEACAPEILSIRRNRQLFVLCRHRPVLAKSLLSGLKEAVRECQFQMKHNRWNCSFGYHSMDYTLLDNPPILNFAGAAWSVARACANGQLTSCTCNNRQHSSQQAWKWGGCSYSIKFGLVNSRRLLTSKHSIHKANLLKLVYKHNLKAGRMALKRTLKRDCKCHGISGSCQMKTCWKSPAEFREIGTHLKKKLSRAMFILQNHSPNDSRYIAQQLKAAELVYFEQSPTYCEPLSHIRSVGTRGRICSVRNQTHSFADCEIVCCGRGYFHQAELVVENCNCKFHWCCQVMCDKCRRTNWISKCR